MNRIFSDSAVINNIQQGVYNLGRVELNRISLQFDFKYNCQTEGKKLVKQAHAGLI